MIIKKNTFLCITLFKTKLESALQYAKKLHSCNRQIKIDSTDNPPKLNSNNNKNMIIESNKIKISKRYIYSHFYSSIPEDSVTFPVVWPYKSKHWMKKCRIRYSSIIHPSQKTFRRIYYGDIYTFFFSWMTHCIELLFWQYSLATYWPFVLAITSTTNVSPCVTSVVLKHWSESVFAVRKVFMCQLN